MINFLLSIIITFFFAKYINWIFLSNRTAFIIINSTFAFLGVCMYFIFVELEFLAIAFAMVYIGGIAVMFLFLILAVEVNLENVTRHQQQDINFLFYLIIFCLSTGIYSFYFNVFSFLITFNDVITIIISSSGLINIEGLNNFFISSPSPMLDLPAYNMSDIEAINQFFKHKPLLLVVISTYLMIATFITLILCSNTFEKFVDA